jgi:hypothetical protein
MRLARGLALTSLVLLFVLAGFACKEEPPAGPPGKEAAKEEPKQEPAKEEPAAGKEPANKAEAGKSAGTEQPAKPADVATPEVGKPAEPVKPALPEKNLQLERTLKKVTVYGVTGPIDATVEAFFTLLPDKLRSFARLSYAGGLGEIAKSSGLKNLDWLDKTRGLGFGLEGKDRPVLAIPITDFEAFKAALPEGIAADENNGYVLGPEVYILPQGKFLFMSKDYRTIDTIEGDLKLELTRMSTDKVFKLIVGGESVREIVATALDGVERSMGESMPMQQPQKEFLAKMFNFVKEVLGDIEAVDVSLGIDQGDLVLTYALKTVVGGKLNTSLASLRGGNFVSAGLLPAKSFLVVAQNIAPEAILPWMPRYVDLVATAWNLKDDEKGEFAKMYSQIASSFGPDSAMSIYSDSGFPLSMSSVAQATGGLATRDLLYKFYGMALTKAVENLPPEQKSLVANRSVKEIVDTFAPMMAGLGVKIEYASEDYQGGKVDSLVLTFDWETLKLPEDALFVKDIIKSRLGGAIGFSDSYMVFTFGPNPVVRAKEVLDKTQGLSLKDVVGAGYEDNRYFGVFALSFDQIVAALLEIPILATLAEGQEWVGKLRQISNLAFFMSAEGGNMTLESRVALQSILQAFEAEIDKAIAEEMGQKDAAAPAAAEGDAAAPTAPVAADPAAPAAADAPAPANP